MSQETEIKIIDVIAKKTPYSQHTHYYVVVDRNPAFVYHRGEEEVWHSHRKQRRLMAHDSGFYSFMVERPGTTDAFAGRKFTINLDDGSTLECNGHVWDEFDPSRPEPVAEVGVATLDDLGKCYVFCGGTISIAKLHAWLDFNKPSGRYYKYDPKHTVEWLDQRASENTEAWGERRVSAARARKLRKRGVTIRWRGEARYWYPWYERRKTQLLPNLPSTLAHHDHHAAVPAPRHPPGLGHHRPSIPHHRATGPCNRRPDHSITQHFKRCVHRGKDSLVSANTELAVVPPKETALTVFSKEKGLDPWLDQVRAKVDEFQKVLPDLKTRKGREAYASMAHQIAKSKTALDAVGKEISAKQKEIPKLIDAESKRVWDKLESWQKEVRKPLDEWEAAEDARVDKHNDGLRQIKDLAVFADSPTAAHVAQVIASLEQVLVDDSWEEFLPEAAEVKDQTLAKLRTLHGQRTQYEAEQAELVRLREEKEARDKKDNEDRIASEAAERATREAEEKAQRERDAQAQRVRDEQAAAEKRENDLKLAAAESERKAEQAKREKVEADQKAERDRLAAVESQKQAVEQARLDEKARADAAADEILRQQQAREADTKHKASINRAALEAFIAGGMPEACAKQAVTLIAQRKIPAVVISY